MARARKAAVTQSKLMKIIYGQQFTGKSTLASEFVYFKRPDGKPFRVLYLDCESGSIDDYIGEMEENGVDLENLYIVYTQSIGEVRQYIKKVKENEDFYELDDLGIETKMIVKDADGNNFRPDAIVVDGVSILNLTTKQGLVEFSKKRNRVKATKSNLIGEERLVKIEGAGLEFKDYQTVNFKGQDLILDLMASGVHCAVTARETDEKVSIKTEDGKSTSVATGKKIPEGFKGMEYNVKTVIRTYTDDSGQICAQVEKDRTKVHAKNEIVEDPTLLDWQVVIDRTADKNSFVIKNDLTKAVDVEQKIYSEEILGESSSDQPNLNNDSSVDNADELRNLIISTLKEMPTVPKTEARKKLIDAKLPTNFKNITDISVLKSILDIIQ